MSNSGSGCRRDANLNVRPPKREKEFPNIKKPQAIGFFSVSGNREYQRNDSQLRYFKEPSPEMLPLDLNAGLSMAIQKPESANNEPLDNILKFIYDHHQRILVRGPNPEFVSWRGLLRLIMCTPYEYRQDWRIHVTRFNNTIYMLKRETDQEAFQRSHQTEHQKTCCAYGFKFEQYCLSETPHRHPDTSGPVNECEEFGMVFHTRLAGLNLMYGAEMDGVMSEKPLLLDYDKPDCNEAKFVELKVRQGNLNQRQYISYQKFKARNWWCQSFLVGINDLYVGIRNDKGFVDAIEHVDVSSLPKNGAQNYWAPWVCANFLLQFLSRLKDVTANENCPYTVYEFYFDAKTGRVTYECLRGKTGYSFIPDWYVNLIRRLTKPSNIAF